MTYETRYCLVYQSAESLSSRTIEISNVVSTQLLERRRIVKETSSMLKYGSDDEDEEDDD